MSLDKADLVIHPIRLRILEALVEGPGTTQDISKQLPDVPKSSMYRHLKVLLDGGIIEVAETRLVQGIQEKVYVLLQPPRLGPGDVAEASRDDHLRYFTVYLVTLLQDFSNYLAGTAEPDFLGDRVGYTEVTFWSTKAEMDVFSNKLNEALQPLLQQEAGADRYKRKLSIINFPMPD